MDLRVILLGTSAGVPSKFRGMPALAIFYQDEVLLFDCGEGTQLQMMRANISFMRIDKIFITHFHGDHIYGLPGLLSTMAFNQRTAPIYIYGPVGLGRVLKAVRDFGYFPRAFSIHCKELGNDVVDMGSYEISSRETDHTVPSLAYSFSEKAYRRFDEEKATALGVPKSRVRRDLKEGKSITVKGKRITPDMVLGELIQGRKVVYSGDTRPCEGVLELAEECDLLIHESTFSSDVEKESYQYGHSTARDCGAIAKRARAKKLILTHISSRYGKAEIMEGEAKGVFERSEVGRDFATYEIRKGG